MPKFVLVIIFLVGLLILIQSNVFYLTGYGYFDLCWTAQHGPTGDKPQTPDQVLAKAKQNAKEEQCEVLANKAIFNDGYVFAGNPEYAVTPELKKIQASCPSSWSDIPIFGVAYYLVDKIADGNYLTLADRFLPAKFVINRVMHSKWPNCSATRQSVGIPMIKEQGDGSWKFDGPCKPCEPEVAASNAKGK